VTTTPERSWGFIAASACALAQSCGPSLGPSRCGLATELGVAFDSWTRRGLAYLIEIAHAAEDRGSPSSDGPEAVRTAHAARTCDRIVGLKAAFLLAQPNGKLAR